MKMMALIIMIKVLMIRTPKMNSKNNFIDYGSRNNNGNGNDKDSNDRYSYCC